MGKTAPKKVKGPASIHSRAVRRATSPGIDTDKSLKEIKPPSESGTHRPSVLAIHQGSGVTKKSKNGRKAVLSSKAKRRQEKGLDRAEAVMDKKATRIEKSRGKARTVQERAKAWEEQNKRILERKAKADAEAEDMDGGSGSDVENEVENGKSDWVDEEAEMNDAPVDAEMKPQDVPLPDAVVEDEDIL